MKRNKLMAAFALSAMFVACTQDAELNETIAKNDYSNIPMVEAEFTVNTGVDSRMATQWGWELQDKVGFAWLGDGQNAEVSGKAFQNNPLYCTDTDGKFKAEGMFYIGKYFAYMPYSEGNHAVEAINFEVTGQTLTTNSADLAKHAIYISPEVYTLEKENENGKVEEGNLPSGIGKNLPLTIARVSNAATINLAFANAEGLADLRVLGVSLDVKEGSGEEVASLLPASFTYAPTESADVEEWTVEALGIGTGETKTIYTVGAISATDKNGIAVVDGALSVKMLTMPIVTGKQISGIEVVVETNYGSVAVTGEDTYNKYGDLCITYGQDGNGDDYELDTTPIFNDVATAGELNVYVNMADLFVGDAEVASQEALTAALNTLVVSGYEKEVNITVNPEKASKDKNIIFTDFTLPEGLKAKVTLTAGSNAENGFVFNGNTKINKYINLESVVTVNGKMTVDLLTDKDDNALTTLEGSNITINNEATLVNNGIVKNTIVTKAKTTDEVAGLYVSNSNKASAETITNEGEIKWIAGVLPESQGGLVYAEVTDFATLAAASKAGVTTAKFVVNTTFGNNGLNLNGGEFNTIKYIEISAPVTINMQANSVTGAAATVEFKNLDNTEDNVAVQIKTGGSLTVVSDKKENTINFGENIRMSLAENTTINLTKVTFDGIQNIDNKGTILTNTSVLKATITGAGSSSSVN